MFLCYDYEHHDNDTPVPKILPFSTSHIAYRHPKKMYVAFWKKENSTVLRSPPIYAVRLLTEICGCVVVRSGGRQWEELGAPPSNVPATM